MDGLLSFLAAEFQAGLERRVELNLAGATTLQYLDLRPCARCVKASGTGCALQTCTAAAAASQGKAPAAQDAERQGRESPDTVLSPTLTRGSSTGVSRSSSGSDAGKPSSARDAESSLRKAAPANGHACARPHCSTAAATSCGGHGQRVSQRPVLSHVSTAATSTASDEDAIARVKRPAPTVPRVDPRLQELQKAAAAADAAGLSEADDDDSEEHDDDIDYAVRTEIEPSTSCNDDLHASLPYDASMEDFALLSSLGRRPAVLHLQLLHARLSPLSSESGSGSQTSCVPARLEGSSASGSSSTMVCAAGHLDACGLAVGLRPRMPLFLIEEAVLGLGAFGLVSRVVDAASGQRYALKRMHRREALLAQVHVVEEQEVVRQLGEADFCVRQLGTFQDARHLYILMELCTGGDLEQLLRSIARKTLVPREGWLAQALAGPRPVWRGMEEASVRFYAAGLLLALGALHSRGIIYRDVKPGNVLLDDQGYPRLADFGMAKCLAGGARGTSTLPCGTVDFMAPEVVRCELYRTRSSTRHGHQHHNLGSARSLRRCASGGITARPAPPPSYGMAADWWSYGATLYTLLTGSKVFCTPEAEAAGEDPSAVLTRALNPRVEIDLPRYLSRECRELLSLLLVRQAKWRLGTVHDAVEIQQHAWFQGFDWAAYKARRVAPPQEQQALRQAMSQSVNGTALAAAYARRGDALRARLANKKVTAAMRVAEEQAEQKLASIF